MDIVDQLSAQYGSGGKPRPSPGGDLVDQLSAQYGLATNAPKYGLVPDIKRGFGQTVSGIGSTLRDLGMQDVGEAVEDYGTGIVKRNPSQINSFSDIIDKPFVTAREAVGEVVPQAGTALAGATVGRIAGGVLGLPFGPPGVAVGSTIGGLAGGLLPVAAQTYGGIRSEQREQGIDDKGRAALVTIPAVALERLGVEKIATQLGTKGLKSFATDQLKPGETMLGYTGRQAMKTGLVEGPFTEIPQTALERYGAYKDLTSAEAFDQYGVAGVKGYVGGAAVGGAMAPFSLQQPTSLLPDTNPPPTPPADTPTAQQPLGLPFYANEPMVVFPDGTTMTAAEARQQRADGFTYSGQPPVTQAPAYEKTPFFEPPLVSTIPGASTLPVLGPQPQIFTGDNPNAQLILPPMADPVQAFRQAYEKQQRGELLTQAELEILRSTPAAIYNATDPIQDLAWKAEADMLAGRGRRPLSRNNPVQGELFDDTPLRSAYDVATRGLPPVAPQGPVLNNQQVPGQAELFFPNGQPTYAATQNVPDVAGAAAETSRAAGIPASKPGSKAGTKRQQLLERIEKARMEGRFVGREAQYDDLVNDLTVNAFGRVEKGIAEIEKAPLQRAAQPGASPLAAPGTRTLQDVDAEMDAMLVNGRAPQGGVAREAWNDLQRERDALAAQVGAPPRPKYVPPNKATKPAKTATPNNAEKTTKVATPLNETPQQAFDAMEDRIAYNDLTPEAKEMVDGAHKEGRLSQEEIDFIVKQDREAKNAAKRAANKPKPEDDLEDDAPPAPKAKKTKAQDVPPAVLSKTEVEIDALNPETGKFQKTKESADEALNKLNEQKDIFQNFVNCLKK